MKICGTFLLLASGAAAFTQAPRPFATKASTESSALLSSYLSDINRNNRFGSTDVREVNRNRPEVGTRNNVQDVRIGRNEVAPLARRDDEQVVRAQSMFDLFA